VTGPNSILIVDDDPRLCRALARYLKQEGYAVRTATSGREMRERLAEERPNLVILDLMLPDEDGFTLARELRATSDLAIVILTGKADTTDKVVGLELGADDYVTKPFSPRELVARVKAALRRRQTAAGTGSGPAVLEFKKLRIDIAGRRVTLGEAPVDLTAIEFDLLRALAENRGRVLTREQLLEKVWGYDYFGDTRVVDVHLGHVRQKLGDESLIATVRGVGYRFEDEPL
jgi:two-component system, OmpR family, alkaline phosphatase synthesis response regulator PhoP